MRRSGKFSRPVPIVALAIAILAIGCGGSDAGPPDRAEFVERADAICKRVAQRQRTGTHEFWVQHPGVIGTPQFREEEQGWKEDLVEFVELPPIQVEAGELRRLQPPNGDVKKVGLIIKEIERAVRRGVKHPSALVERGSVGPFERVERMARSYGLRACAHPPLNP